MVLVISNLKELVVFMKRTMGFWVGLGGGGGLVNFVVGLALVGKDIVCRFIIEYSSSLRDFYRPLGNNNNRFIFLYEDF
jgi:hypothetical protein